jgi:hypothetical protein
MLKSAFSNQLSLLENLPWRQNGSPGDFAVGAASRG